MRSGWCGCWLLFVVLSACGGDDQTEPERADAAAEPPIVPVDPEKRLTELSGDETARVCGALSDRFDDLLSSKQYLELSCTQQAWPVSFDFSNITGELMGSPTRCKELVSMCIDKGGALGDFTP